MLANDTNRSIDEFGYMTVENCILTGEDVAKYYGFEIPFYKDLKLEPDKIYHVYRPKNEIKDSNFSNKPLLSKHADFSADDYKYKLIIGTIGDTSMESDQMHGTVVFWDKKAISELEKGKKHLSCGYMYDPVVEKGTYNNSVYEIKMTNIVANHVALVDNPRYKPAIVADTQIEIKNKQFSHKGEKMFFKKKTQPKISKDAEGEKYGIHHAMKEIKDCMDDEEMSPEEKKKHVDMVHEKLKEHMGKDKGSKDDEMSPVEEYEEEETAEDEELENVEQKEEEKKEFRGTDKAKDKMGKDKMGKDSKKSMTGDAIQRLVADSVAKEMEKFYQKNVAFDSAITEYERIFGRVNRQAFDSAENVLDTILKNKKINSQGKSFEQKQAMVEMIQGIKTTQTQSILTTDNSSVKNHTPANILKFLKKVG